MRRLISLPNNLASPRPMCRRCAQRSDLIAASIRRPLTQGLTMATPHPALDAAVNQFAQQPGVTPADVSALRAAIRSDRCKHQAATDPRIDYGDAPPCP